MPASYHTNWKMPLGVRAAWVSNLPQCSHNWIEATQVQRTVSAGLPGYGSSEKLDSCSFSPCTISLPTLHTALCKPLLQDKKRDSWINSTPVTLPSQDAARPKGPLPFLKTLAPHQKVRKQGDIVRCHISTMCKTSLTQNQPIMWNELSSLNTSPAAKTDTKTLSCVTGKQM